MQRSFFFPNIFSKDDGNLCFCDLCTCFTAPMLASETDCDPICLENKVIHIQKEEVSTKSFGICPEDASKFGKKQLYHLILVHHVLYQAGYISLMSQQRWPKNNADVLRCHPVDI
uniref:Uncharacterized protein n=1 Tax=Micrurus lemniscatus lemniscatus TaxID=129467 RepID=A0A2D4JMG4_MICLE